MLKTTQDQEAYTLVAYVNKRSHGKAEAAFAVTLVISGFIQTAVALRHMNIFYLAAPTFNGNAPVVTVST